MLAGHCRVARQSPQFVQYEVTIIVSNISDKTNSSSTLDEIYFRGSPEHQYSTAMNYLYLNIRFSDPWFAQSKTIRTDLSSTDASTEAD